MEIVYQRHWMEDVTRALNALSYDDSSSDKTLLENIYSELHAMASNKMAGEASAHTLQATALVNEAYLRLAGNGQTWENRRHFFGAASEAMRRVLVDAARRRTAAKRGGGKRDETLDEEAYVLPVGDERVLEIHEVLDELERKDAMKAQIVKLRFFVGLTHKEIAELFEVSDSTDTTSGNGEPGALHGLTSSSNKGREYFAKACSKVKVEGKPLIRFP
jgi:RNA polymerase sigma factor (TIGR02999 family)